MTSISLWLRDQSDDDPLGCRAIAADEIDRLVGEVNRLAQLVALAEVIAATADPDAIRQAHYEYCTQSYDGCTARADQLEEALNEWANSEQR